MKHVAIIFNNDPTDGGAFQYNQAILDAFLGLPQDKFEKTIFYTNDFWELYLSRYPHTFVKLKLTPRLNKTLKAITLFKLPIALRKALLYILSPRTASHLNDNRINLILFPSQDTVSLFTTIPKVNVIHDLMHRYESRFPEVSNNGRIKYRDILFKTFCDESRGIIVDSKVGRQHVQELYKTSGQKIFELPFIPPPYILSQAPLPDDFEEKYGNLPARFLFYPSQFWPHKNHRNLLLAISRLIDQGVEINMVFGGKLLHEYNNIVKLIDELKLNQYVSFLDYVPDEYLRGIYLKARGFVMPTYFGPTNIPPLEAIFLGCPAAVSKIYGMPDQLQDASLYFDPNDINSIAEKLEILWIDEEQREKLIKNGRKITKAWNKTTFNIRFREIIENII